MATSAIHFYKLFSLKVHWFVLCMTGFIETEYLKFNNFYIEC